MMAQVISLAGKGELLVMEIAYPQASARRKSRLLADQQQLLAGKRLLVDAMDDSLLVMDQNTEIDEPLAELIVQQGVKAIDHPQA